MRKIDDIKDTKYLHILINEDLKMSLIHMAKEKGLSLNSYIRMLLTLHVNKELENEK